MYPLRTVFASQGLPCTFLESFSLYMAAKHSYSARHRVGQPKPLASSEVGKVDSRLKRRLAAKTEERVSTHYLNCCAL